MCAYRNYKRALSEVIQSEQIPKQFEFSEHAFDPVTFQYYMRVFVDENPHW